MDYEITIAFKSTNIKKYIKESKLIIGDKTFNINKNKCFRNADFVFKIIPNTLKKIKILNIVLDFFIDNKCVYYCMDREDSYGGDDLLIYDIDKNLFYKCFYWTFNSDLYDDDNDVESTIYICALAQDKKFIRLVKKTILEGKSDSIGIPFQKDLSILKFICKTCKKNMLKKEYNTLINEVYANIHEFGSLIIKKHGITFFKLMNKYNIFESYVLYLNKSSHMEEYKELIETFLKLNQLDIIDFSTRYGLSLEKFEINDSQILISIIKNDNAETFLYVLENIKIPNKTIQETIEKTGSFITKEYVEILFNNEKLDLENLKLLNKSIKNNTDIKLKKYALRFLSRRN